MPEQQSKKDKLRTIHNNFFQAAISHIQVARGLFQQFLPKHIQQCIDFNSLTIWQNQFTRADLYQFEADAVYQGKLKAVSTDQKKLKSADKCYCYIHVEQQTKPERYLPLRLLAYKCDILLQHAKQYPGKSLPPVFCIVIHNGKRRYPYTINLFDMFVEPAMAEETLLNPATLIDLPKVPDKDLSTHAWSGSMLGLLKYVRRADLSSYIHEQLYNLLGQIEKEAGVSYITSITHYIFDGSDIKTREEFQQLIHGAVSPDIEEEMMTLAERIKEKGKQEGWQEGKQKGWQEGKQEGWQEGKQEGWQEGKQEREMEIAKKLLIEGAEPAFVVKITGLQLATIRDLQASLAEKESI